ncbi:MAG TPA: hypothetical protein VEJ21_01530 [Acidimicrobiales bacterium]|nr:hypothetical protein [Acidimicrobiales bacterium]
MRSRWFSRRAVLAHLALAVWVPGCAVAAWWQVGIALGGDGLGWVYSVMWPCFAVFGTVFWWFLVHDDPNTLGARGLRSAVTGAADVTGRSVALDDASSLEHRRLAQAEAEDAELADYNAYLSSLAAQQKTWRRR